MNLIQKILKNKVKGRKVLILFILSSMVYAVMIFVTIPKLIYFGNGMDVLDMMPFGYSYPYVTQLFTELGVDGRNYYLNYQIPIDMVYPYLFGLSYFYIMTYVLLKINLWKSTFIYLSILPVIGALFDYFENIGTILMLRNYPNLNPSVVQLNSFFTISKSILSTLFFISLMVILVIFSIKKVSKK